MSLDTVMDDFLEAVQYVDSRFQDGADVDVLYQPTQLQGGEDSQEARDNIKADRDGAAALFTPAGLQQIFHPHVREALRAVGTIPSRNNYISNLRLLIRHFVDNGLLFKSREMTFDDPALTNAGHSSADGDLYRVSEDKYGYPLECRHAEAMYARCIKDQLSGAGGKHREVFRVYGENRPASPWLARSGSGITRDIEAMDINSGQFLQNPGFEDNSGSDDGDAPSSLASGVRAWTLECPSKGTAGFALRKQAVGETNADIFRGFKGSENTVLWALEANAPFRISQNIQKENPSASYSRDLPYITLPAIKRKNAATGTIEMRLGKVIKNISLASFADDTYVQHVLSEDEQAYYRQFGAQQDVELSFWCPDLATGEVVFDDVVHAPMQNVDGTYYALVGGATPFLRDDRFDWTDVQGATTFFSFWLWASLEQQQSTALLQQLGMWIPTTPTASEIYWAE